MSENVGRLDRIVRVVVGLPLILLGLALFGGVAGLGSNAIAAVLAIVVGAILAGTAAIGQCPLYELLGIDTCDVGT
jgi:hypothetical protein